MRPSVWRPPVVLSPAEQAVVKRVRRAKLFVWLREHRHELLDDAFQAELAAAYHDSERGHPPVPPAQLALATILQAYTGASDDEVLEATVMIGAGSWCWTVGTPSRRRSARQPWSASAPG
jgi:hypothetical protein